MHLFQCYIPPSNSRRQGIIESNIFHNILQNILHIKHITNDACYIVLLGDLNSRIGRQNDCITDDFATHIDAFPNDNIFLIKAYLNIHKIMLRTRMGSYF